MMKRVVSAVLLLCLLCGFCVCTVSAWYPGMFVAYLVKGELKQGETITVRFELDSLYETAGAVMTECHIGFDTDTLEYVSCKANHPDGWDLENEIAEDWCGLDTKENEDGSAGGDSINFTVMNAQLDCLIKDDGVLFLDVDFKLKKDVEELSFNLKEGYWVSFFYQEEKGRDDFKTYEIVPRTIEMSMTPPERHVSEDKTDGLSTGALVAIIAGSAVVVGGVATGLVLVSKKKKSK